MFKDLFETLGKCIRDKDVRTSGLAFKLLTTYTVNILISCSLLITLKQFFGDPIDCDVGDMKLKSVVQTKCWMEGVFIDRRLLDGEVGKTITRFGVGAVSAKGLPNDQDFIYQSYYQWVAPVLLLQAFVLYTPRAVWRLWENGLMKKLLRDTDSAVPEERWQNSKIMIVRFIREVSKQQHNIYLAKYIICEILACVALFINFWIMKLVFNDFWQEYMPAMKALFSSDMEAFSRSSARLFPTQAKCYYRNFGSSGGIQNHDSICFLPQNVINEKIFVFLYVWFIFLFVIAILNLIVIFLLGAIKALRTSDLRRMSNTYFSQRFRSFFMHYSDFGYWFTLHIIYKNLSPILFQDLMSELMKSNDWRRPKDEEAKVGETKYPTLKQPQNFTLSNSTSEDI